MSAPNEGRRTVSPGGGWFGDGMFIAIRFQPSDDDRPGLRYYTVDQVRAELRKQGFDLVPYVTAVPA
jgi:hypothetical protein